MTSTGDVMKLIKEKGMEVYEPTAAELAAFKKAMDPVYEEYKPILGAEVMLQGLGQDPAVASSVFVLTTIDLMGFFVFLGLASVTLL